MKNATGTIYFVTFGSDDEDEPFTFVKIGFTDDLYQRLANMKTAMPYEIVLLGSYPGTKADEKRIHALLAEHKHKREWFRLSDEIGDFMDDLEDARWLLVTQNGDDYEPTIRECLDYDGARDEVDAIIRAGRAAGLIKHIAAAETGPWYI